MAVRDRRLAALILFAALAILHSWPLAGDLAHLSRYDNPDAELNTWIVAWVAHVLPIAPLRLFEATIFHPEAHTLAYADHLLVQALMGAPFLWLGVSPVAVHNGLIILGLALSGAAMCLLMMRWTGSAAAGIVAGLLYGFNAHVLTRFVHLQAQHVEFYPVILYALDRVLARSATGVLRNRHVWLLAAALVLQSLCSGYLLAFSVFTVFAALVVRPGDWLGPGRLAAATRTFAACAVSAVVIAPFLWPYYEVARDQGLARTIDEVRLYSASWLDYLSTGGRLHYAWWSHRIVDPHTSLFPGVTALVLTGIAIGSGAAWRDSRARTAVAAGVIGLALSFGPALPGYTWLFEHVPLIAALRNAARWGWLALAAISILAGFGAAQLFAAIERRGHSVAIAAVLTCALVTAESIRTPVGFTRFEGFPRIYDRLAGNQHLVLVEFPIFGAHLVTENGRYVLNNTRYFKPLIEGYSGFQPPAFEARAARLRAFPDTAAIDELHTLGVTHVMVHHDAFTIEAGSDALDRVRAVDRLELIAEEDGISLYRLH